MQKSTYLAHFLACMAFAACHSTNPTIQDTPKSSVTDPTCDAYKTKSYAASSLALTSALEPDKIAPGFLAVLESAQAKLGPQVSFRTRLEDSLSLQENSAAAPTSQSINFAHEGVPFCRNYLDMHQIQDRVYVFDKSPHGETPWEEQDFAKLTWSNYDLGLDKALGTLDASDKSPKSIEAKRCILHKDRTLWAAWDLSFTLEGLPYMALVGDGDSGTIFEAAPKFLEVDAYGTAYEKTPLASTNVEIYSYPLKDLTGSGILCNPRVWIDPGEETMAISESLDFSYDPSQLALFEQTNLFVNIEAHTNWLYNVLPVGKTIPTNGGAQVNVVLSPEQTKAVYLPATSSSQPRILLGAGDGAKLQNLRLDDDVVSHERGHHEFYRKLTSTQGDSVPIHEGVADYLVFARTGNTCLGETICPNNSASLCINAQCLRDPLAKTWKYTDADFANLSAHKKGQLISGLMWDIGLYFKNQNKAANLLLKSIDYLTSDAGYVEFVTALMMADKALYQGADSCQIRTLADNRGLKGLLDTAQIECSNYQ